MILWWDWIPLQLHVYKPFHEKNLTWILYYLFYKSWYKKQLCSWISKVEPLVRSGIILLDVYNNIHSHTQWFTIQYIDWCKCDTKLVWLKNVYDCCFRPYLPQKHLPWVWTCLLELYCLQVHASLMERISDGYVCLCLQIQLSPFLLWTISVLIISLVQTFLAFIMNLIYCNTLINSIGSLKVVLIKCH